MIKAFAQSAMVTLASRVLGFIRDILLARYIGASWCMDAFLIAFKLPNLFRRLVAEGAFSQALIPAVVKSKHPAQLLQTIFGGVLCIVLCISVPFVFFPQIMLGFFVQGLSPQSDVFLAASEMLPVIFPYLLFMTCCGFYTVQLNIAKRYVVGSALPIILNLCLILGGYISFKTQKLTWLSYAVFLSGAIQLLICIIAVYRAKGVLSPKKLSVSPEVKRTLTQAGSGFLAQILTYFSSLFDLLVVSFLSTGSLSWLYYSERLAYLPVGVVSVVLANIILPSLSLACHQGNHQQSKVLIDKATMLIAVVGVPLVCGGILLAESVVSCLFLSKHFQAYDVAATALSLKVMLIAVPAFMLNKVWGTVPYAFSESEVQLKMTIKAVVAGILVTGLTFTVLGHIAIAVGGCISAWVGFYQLFGYTQKKISYKVGCFSEILFIVQASLLMVGVVLLADKLWPGSTGTRLYQGWVLGGKILLGIATYLLFLMQKAPKTILSLFYQPMLDESLS
ncbi:MAG: murein biosynthesis integral membrane protein MurJ [Pseudomonadota bacterium]|nr:murein biosynthesis integral membrane protein MurJ [Pseudomonadota bacterium]